MHDDFLSDQAAQTQEEAKGWIASLPWYVKLGAPIIGLVIAIPVGFHIIGGIINPNPGSLNPDQFKAVTTAGEAYFSAQKATFSGVTESGKLASCSASDSDGDRRVTCTGSVPTLGKDADGKATLVWSQKAANCDVPLKGASGCKAK
jgi:hypothetical protein